jgi:hypothetical protein
MSRAPSAPVPHSLGGVTSPKSADVHRRVGIEIKSSRRRRRLRADTAHESFPHRTGKSRRANYISNINNDDPADRYPLKKYVLIFLFLIIAPLLVSAANYLRGDRRGNWQTADRSSAGLLPAAADHPEALIRIYAARTVRWRGIFAVHTWIVLKERGAAKYSRYDYTAWGEPIRVDGFAADGRWFGATPQAVARVDGPEAEKLIPAIRSVIENYKFRAYGDYSAWPGPNSNTFVQAVLDGVPGLNAVLPPTAIGKDYPYRGEWCGLTASRTGVFVSLGGYLGLTIGWVEGLEVNFLGGVLGLDIRRPALKFPGIGRLGVPLSQ